MKPKIFTVRAATDADFSQLCELFAELDAQHLAFRPDLFRPTSQPPRTREDIAARIEGPHTIIFVAADNHGWGLLGLASLVLREIPESVVHKARRVAEVDNLVVRQNVRRLGIGRALLERASAWAVQQKTDDLSLGVYEFNANALAFYEAVGFTTLTRRMVRNHL